MKPSLASWLLGYPDRALTEVANALAVGQDQVPKQPFTLGYALLSSVWLRQFRGESSLVLREATAAVEFATDQGFPVWYAHARALQGWARAMLGEPATGVAMVEEALTSYDETGAIVWRPLLMLLECESLIRAGRVDDAVRVVERALAIAGAMVSYWWSAELHRLRGELRRSQVPDDLAFAEQCFREAITIAQTQGAKSLELRARTSLTRLHGHVDDACACRDLVECLHGLSEGFDLADLVNATVLLEQHGHHGSTNNRSITSDVRPVVEALNELLRRPHVMASLLDARSVALRQLDADPQSGAVSVSVDIGVLGPGIPHEVGSVRVVVGRGVNEGRNERHPTSEQYLFVLNGPVHTHVKIGDEWRIDNYGASLNVGADALLEDCWHVVPRGVWHRSVAPSGGLWGVVALHSEANVSDEFDLPRVE
jgi:hypothetical protein